MCVRPLRPGRAHLTRTKVMSMPSVFISMLIGLTVLSLSSCSKDDKAPNCRKDSDCPQSQYCYYGAAVLQGCPGGEGPNALVGKPFCRPGGTGSLGSPCKMDWDCQPPSLVCDTTSGTCDVLRCPAATSYCPSSCLSTNVAQSCNTCVCDNGCPSGDAGPD
jgi:hypothetical protein